jgi:hypothetical protein
MAHPLRPPSCRARQHWCRSPAARHRGRVPGQTSAAACSRWRPPAARRSTRAPVWLSARSAMPRRSDGCAAGGWRGGARAAGRGSRPRSRRAWRSGRVPQRRAATWSPRGIRRTVACNAPNRKPARSCRASPRRRTRCSHRPATCRGSPRDVRRDARPCDSGCYGADPIIVKMWRTKLCGHRLQKADDALLEVDGFSHNIGYSARRNAMSSG